VTQNEQVVNELAVTTLGSQWTNGQCSAAKVVSNGQVVWTLTAKGSMSAVENFIASFQPIG
jgi:hypothetical protein